MAKLSYPKWFNIIFILLTIIFPLSLLARESFFVPETTSGLIFRISFTSFGVLIIVWLILKKLLITPLIIKLLASQVALSHDYNIKVGDSNKIKQLWLRNEKYLTIFNFITIILYGGLASTILLGVAGALIAIRGILVLIIIAYILAYTLKFIILITRGDIDEAAD